MLPRNFRAFVATLMLIGGAPVTRAADLPRFHLTPYIWTAGIDGTVGVAGQQVSVDASFDDLVEFVDVGGAVRFEGRGERWGGFVDYFGVTLEDDRRALAGTIRTRSKQTIAEAGATYRVAERTELLAGLRYQSLDNRISVPVLGSFSDDQGWTDAFVGARWAPVMTGKWAVWLRGDIGAGQSDLTWLASAGAGYRFTKTVGIVAAYRYLDTDYQDGDFKWDVAQRGLGFGLDFAW